MNDNLSQKSNKELQEEVSELQRQLYQADENFKVINRGDIDALVLPGNGKQRIITLNSVIVDEISEGVVAISNDGTIIFCNIQFSNIVSIPVNKLTGSNFELLIFKPDKHKFKSLLNEAINKRVNSEIAFSVNQLKDEHYYFSFSPLPKNSLGDICIIITDITEIKKQEEELQDSHSSLEKTVKERTNELSNTVEDLSNSRIAALNLMEDALEAKKDLEKTNLELQDNLIKLREADEELRFDSTLLNAVGQAVIATDKNGIITYWNKAAESIYGWKYEEVIEKNIVDVTPTDQTKTQAVEILNKLKNGESWSGEFYVKGKDGISFPAFVTNSPVHNEDGKISGIIGVSTDITDRKLIQKELIDEKEKAEEMNRLKTNFLANMSHELRTPLIGILGYAEFLEGELEDKEHSEMVSIIQSSGQRLNTTLNNILDISKIESEIKNVDLKEQDILKYLNEQVTLFKLEAEKKGLSIFYKPYCKQLEAFINEEMFVSIISNLLNNAIKFTNKGSITLTVKLAEDKAMISIIDTGIGLSADKQEIIFEPFRQVSEGLGRYFEGTGLGLTLARKFAMLMGGKISVESNLADLPAGKAGGSTFTLELPLNKNNEDNVININGNDYHD